MAKTKKKIEIFDFYDVEGMQRRLEAMAQQGWIIEHIDNDIWTYRKEQPQNIHFAVTHFDSYSNSEAEPDRGQSEYLEMCAAAGWQLAARYNSLFVFINNSENPVPLETDAVTQVENINETMKTDFGSHRIYAAIVLLVLPFARNLMELVTDPVKFVNDPGHLFTFSVIAAYIAMFAVEKLNYRLWYKKAARVAETTGEFVQASKNRQPLAMIAEVILLLVAVELSGKSFDPLFLTGIYISLALASAVYFYGLKLKKSVRLVVAVAVIALSTAIMYFSVNAAGFTPVEIKHSGEENMPVSMEKLDIQPTTQEYVSFSTEYRCFLFDKYEGSQEYLKTDAGWMVDDFSYTLVKVKSPGFYNSLKRDYINKLNHNKNMGIEYWKAWETYDDTDMAYKDHYKYQIFYGDAILIMRTPTVLSEKQISTIVTDLVGKYI